jgi:hypothetical protein
LTKYAIEVDGRLLFLTTNKRHEPNELPYILPFKSPYRSGYRYCRTCEAFIKTERDFCPDDGTLLRMKPH